MDVKEQKRFDIAEAARELFTEFGYKSVSMDQIAMRAKVAKGTLYLYFKDKETLFYELADQLLSEMKRFVSSLEQRNLTLADEMHEGIYFMLSFRRKQKFLYKVMQEARDFRTPASMNVEKKFDEEIVGYIQRRLDQGVRAGLIKPCNTSILSFVIKKVYTALAFEWEETHEPLNERQIAESASLILQTGLFNT